MGVQNIYVCSLVSAMCVVGCADTVTSPCPVTQDRLTGQYQLAMNEVEGGDCGGMGSLNVVIQHGVVVPDERIGCELRAQDWEQDICTNHSVLECDDGEWKMTLSWMITGDPTFNDQISGELHAEMDRWNGAYTCASTYTFEVD